MEASDLLHHYPPQQNRPPLLLEELLYKSIYFVNEEPEIGIHISFESLKSYCIPDIYNIVIEHIVGVISYATKTYTTYNIYVNLKGITITSMDKYRDFLMKCSNVMLQYDEFYTQLNHIYVIQAPTFVKQLLTIIKTITPTIINNIKVVPNEKK
jgi:hypothetical protein